MIPPVHRPYRKHFSPAAAHPLQATPLAQAWGKKERDGISAREGIRKISEYVSVWMQRVKQETLSILLNNAGSIVECEKGNLRF